MATARFPSVVDFGLVSWFLLTYFLEEKQLARSLFLYCISNLLWTKSIYLFSYILRVYPIFIHFVTLLVIIYFAMYCLELDFERYSIPFVLCFVLMRSAYVLTGSNWCYSTVFTCFPSDDSKHGATFITDSIIWDDQAWSK